MTHQLISTTAAAAALAAAVVDFPAVAAPDGLGDAYAEAADADAAVAAVRSESAADSD